MPTNPPVGLLLATLLPRTVYVGVDALRDFIPAVPLGEAIPINVENAVGADGESRAARGENGRRIASALDSLPSMMYERRWTVAGVVA